MQPRWQLFGQRLRLRPLMLADAADVFAYASDPCVTEFLEWKTHQALSDSIAFIEQSRSVHWHGITFAVELLGADRVIGTVELRVTSRAQALGDIGYVLARPFWGQGYNLEAGAMLLFYAFRIEGLRRVSARCSPRNRRSARTLEKLGMRQQPMAAVRSVGAGIRSDLEYSLTNVEWARHPIHLFWRENIRWTRAGG
ncbi:MAG: N-acetyltransferase [Candidatus Binatia bacterium]|nr:MAG: N-acetyltransferase [Candidatus Binatia bacterium]